MKIKNLLKFFIVTTFLLVHTNYYAQGVPVANFTWSPNPVCSGAVITFSDLSTGNPTSWSYTIGNQFGFPPPTVFTTQNPTLTFNFPTTYTVRLIATNANGSSTAITKTITVVQGVNANINPANANSCIGGNPVILNVNSGGGPGGGGGLSYSWSNGFLSSSISITPTVTTVYSCVVTSTAGCSATAFATVNITTPTVNIVSVPANICPGSTSTLTASSTGGGPYSYTWSNSTNSAAITTSVPGVFSATVSNNQGCSSVQTITLGSSTTLSLTITPSPSVLCAGNTATLRVIGASNYTWNTGSSAANIAVSPMGNTNYFVFGSLGICTGSAALTLSVSTSPTITVASSPSSICPGSSATLTANGASAYTWTPGNINTSSVVVTPSNTTVYSVRGVNPGCAARTVTAGLTVVPGPNISIFTSGTVICNGDVLALSAVGASSYTWSTGNNGGTIVHSPTVSTIYTVTGSNASNCIGMATLSVTVNECVGLNSLVLKSNELIVYPNPSNGMLNIEGKYTGELLIMNTQGQLIKSVLLDEQTKAVSIELKTPGIYFIMTADKSIVNKIVVTQ